ncbi:3-methyladenine DNA glycosylase AlkD [Peribacillus deserti]|uniref:3-methyladenine DNA glycosylase AlkD n=1 Tax=Peribacillus deserti TaxID=673318 RepID=A0ABS2QBV7_9BACI|nr:DNA alkylation repair protein [Peribacillus deserti]MBM7690609.1 3-methyladenine DNA glycosylase AlkD [Peribacillus deserti]
MELAQQLYELMKENKKAENRVPMENYMKNQFPFFGIKSPERKKIVSEFFKEAGMFKEPFSHQLVRELWSFPEREMQYAALDYSGKYTKKFAKEDILFFKELVITKSWWDTVDSIAPPIIGEIAMRFPEAADEYIENWAVDENMWLRRTAILFQLKYKNNTDVERLYRYIRLNADSKEFFIQKAIGWALREYSKTDPASVRRFIETTALAKLSIREGSKYL